jgi:hypothetical protein
VTIEIVKVFDADAGYGHGWHLIVDGEYWQTFGTKREAEIAAARARAAAEREKVGK